MLAVALLAAALRLVSIGGVRTNPFYDAAVRSMSQSWHNFFFAAFEPAGGVSIDKPPVDLWLQVVSVKLLGFNTTALILPQAIAATIAVPLLYDIVRRLFGHWSALASALALAVLPISVLTARSDTMDSLMMALNVFAAWLVLRAAQTGRVRWLVAAGAVMGLNFDVKLLEALLALPALVLIYALGARDGIRRRAGGLALAGVVFVTFALSWPTLVSLSPRSARPFPIGSTNGSVWNAIFVFNGTNRLNPPQNTDGGTPAPRGRRAARQAPKPRALPAPPPPPAPASKAEQVQGKIVGYGTGPGLGRLFNLGGYHFGQDFGIELAGALVFGAIALAGGGLAELRRRRPGTQRGRRDGGALVDGPPPRSDLSSIGRSGASPEAGVEDARGAAPGGHFRRILSIFSPRAGRTPEADGDSALLRPAAALAFAAWVLLCFAVFSRVKGVLHPRYLEAMTPAVAVGLGAGLVACARLAARSGVWLTALLLGLALTGAYALDVGGVDTTAKALTVTGAVGGALCAVTAWLNTRRRGRLLEPRIAAVLPLAAAGLCLLSILSPAAKRSTLIVQSHASDGGSPGYEPPRWVNALSSYLKPRTGNSRYELASYSFAHAAPLIVHDGRPVLVLTSILRRPVVSVKRLVREVRSGALRYALIEGDCGTSAPAATGGCAPTIRWIRHHSVDVTAQTGLQDRGVLFRINAGA